MAFRAQIGGRCDTIGRNAGCADAVEVDRWEEGDSIR